MAKPPLAMNGNGCAGSIASGDRIGNTCSKKCVSISRRSAPLRSSGRRISIPSAAHRRFERDERLLLAHHQRPRVGVDPRQLLGRRQAVGRRRVHALAHQAAQAGDAHRVELVEVRGRDRQEPHPLEQRHGRVLGLGHHPPVEGEPRKLAVDEAAGPAGVEVGHVPPRRRRRVQEVGVDLRGLVCHDFEHQRLRLRPWIDCRSEGVGGPDESTTPARRRNRYSRPSTRSGRPASRSTPGSPGVAAPSCVVVPRRIAE